MDVHHEERGEEEGRRVFEYDKHVLVSNQWDLHIDPRTDDEREPVSLLRTEEQVYVQPPSQMHPIHPLHTHDTASGSDDQQPLSLPYFTRLKNQIRLCHDT